ncbi:leucine-rich repeat domain-containing protein [Legionella fallonii]|uniref:Uncharacterized protein n=1 Tax=Legionella fallonii LLAP-10 TaxID=1212491 RepID=A0A098G1Z0_9GAMM|nr:hypothetical protein [Legionella fallonii]CEG56001.1 protein of unknown function [LEUCINE RICH REPEAT-CONTAINING] [Legionella fallonii LLAP-10]
MRPEILEKITANKNMTTISLVDMEIEDYEIKEIIETIKQRKPTPTIIDLDRNKITDEGAVTLSEQLSDFNEITQLSIQFNNIGRIGAIHLFRLKKDFSELDILFHGNKIKNVSEMDEIEHLALQETPRLS